MRNIMKNVLISWCWRSDGPPCDCQLADKQTIKQTLFARRSKNPQTLSFNGKIIMGDVLNHAALKQAMQGQDVVYANLTGKI